MRAIIQRVKAAEVQIQQVSVGKINQGFLILLGIHKNDTPEDVDYLVRKISKLRVFEDEQGKMNESIQDIQGSILSVSQFTLYADTKKGNRPSFIEAARPDQAIPLYELFNEKIKQAVITLQTGEFGADMQVSLINDGPVTIMIDTLEKTT